MFCERAPRGRSYAATSSGLVLVHAQNTCKRINTHTHIEARDVSLYTHIRSYPGTHVLLLHVQMHKYAAFHPSNSIHIYKRTCTYIHMYIHTCIHTYIHTYTYIGIYTLMYIHIHTYRRTYTYIHTSMHTYIHAYIHTKGNMHAYTHRWYINVSIHYIYTYIIHRHTFIHNFSYLYVHTNTGRHTNPSTHNNSYSVL
jgi:hypothetical protein